MKGLRCFVTGGVSQTGVTGWLALEMWRKNLPNFHFQTPLNIKKIYQISQNRIRINIQKVNAEDTPLPAKLLSSHLSSAHIIISAPVWPFPLSLSFSLFLLYRGKFDLHQEVKFIEIMRLYHSRYWEIYSQFSSDLHTVQDLQTHLPCFLRS